MKNGTGIALLALGVAAGSAVAQQGLYPVRDVRTVGAATEMDEKKGDTRVVVEVPTMDRLEPFRRYVIDPFEVQNAPGRFEIRVDGTIRNYARVTNGFVRAQRYVANRLEEARIAWLREHGHVGGVATYEGAGAGDERAAIEPRATIRMPEGASGGGGFRVQAPKADRARLVAALERMEAHRAAARATTEPERESAVASAD